MMFLDCPAYLDQDGAARCGLPAAVKRWFTMGSTDAPMESAMIRCPVGHWFNGPIEFLTWQGSHPSRNTSDQPINAVSSGSHPSDGCLTCPPPRPAGALGRRQ